MWLDDTVPVVPGSWRNPCIWKVVGKSRILWFVQKSQKSTAIIVLDVSLLFEAMTKIKNSQDYYRTDKIDKFEIQWDNDSDLGHEVMMIVMVSYIVLSISVEYLLCNTMMIDDIHRVK